MAPAMAQAPGSSTNGEAINRLTEAYVLPMYVPTPLKTYTPPSWTYCSCVNFAKTYLGVKDEVWGFAGRITPNVTDPEVGDVLLTNEGGGHAAIITNIEDGILSIVEANYLPCKVTHRTIPIDSKKIRGYKRVSG